MNISTANNKSITWKIGGEAGFGIMTTGLMFSKVASRSGFSVFDYIEYPSLIRGGHNVMEVRYSNSEVTSQEKGVDLLICLNQETLKLHINELKSEGGIVFDPEKVIIDKTDLNSSIVLLPVPFSKIIKDIKATILMQNNVVLGVSAALLGLSKDILISVIEDTFSDKGTEVIEINKKSALAGFDYVSSNLLDKFKRMISSGKFDKRLVIAGNEAIALGAIAAGCGLYVAYPMSPSSSVLHYLAQNAEKTGMVVKHAEDEISVINMAIGASYAGVRSMVGTSGGGFSLMVEGVGLAGITETPLVVFVAQRPGPATGMPTWTGQADLKFVIHASQDEFPRIILAPGDPEEAFYLTAEAFNLADIYQTPVFVLSDKYLSESHKSTPVFNIEKININRGKVEQNDLANYQRYQDTPDGISPRVIPGTKGTYFLANSYEHEENGLSTEEAKERIKQVQKRSRKLITYISQMPKPKVYGDEQADITIIGWGSTKGPVLQALSDTGYKIKDKSVNFLHLTHVWPINMEFITQFLKKAKRKVIIEGNSEGQMASLIKEQCGITMDNILLKYDGRPFYPEEIINLLAK